MEYFHLSNEKFREMFENKFKLTISRATVQRFFKLLEELQILTVNEGRRKNRTQSANLFIVEPMEQKTTEELKNDVETPDDTPVETVDNISKNYEGGWGALMVFIFIFYKTGVRRMLSFWVYLP